ncbi:hypothetical protein NQ314_020224 [Rhamnusium bicolor]|uniref:Longin domain-containing protein n=1 Tax=Rhamnusium bicolor TaxID=1586634 RepID=A0AAV8WNP8_9CUCU|nr:hypothetical protein NQ314_020224 [Rhamnusium bicolor]
MVKLYCISILYKGATNATWLKSAFELQSFSFFQRGSVQEFMSFFCKTIVERTIPASRQSVKEGEYMCHVYVRADNLAGVVITDLEYPSRVSHTLITKILDEFVERVPAANWPNLQERDVAFPQLNVYLTKYQNPREADAMTKIQEDLDETKIILVRKICSSPQTLLFLKKKLYYLISKLKLEKL